MKIWWHVCITGKPAFGFSSIDGIVSNFPEYHYNGRDLQYLKPWLLRNGAKVYKAAEQILN